MRPLIGAVDGDQFTASMLGLCVERATAALPQSTTVNIFTIAGGAVCIYGIIGRVTTIIQAQATTFKLTSTPTIGTAVDICTTVDLTGLEVGGWIAPTLSVSGALVKGLAGGIFNTYGFFIAPAGVISATTVASSTGAIRWTLFYAPLDPGAAVSAA